MTDANALRFDPGLQAALRRIAGSPEATLASQPTLSRLEEGIEPVELSALSDWLLEQYVGWLRKKGRKGWRGIILDMESTDDPTHGAQQMTMFHGFYDQWMYHPLLVFDSRGFPAAVLLRPGNAHDSWEAVAVRARRSGSSVSSATSFTRRPTCCSFAFVSSSRGRPWRLPRWTPCVSSS